MNADSYFADFQASLREHSQADPRHQQTLNGVIGASDFSCRQELAYIIAQEPVSDPEHLFNWAAFCGSALDDRLQMVRASNRPHLRFKQKVPVTLRLPNGEDYTFTASPDEIDPVEFEVTDFKGLTLDTPLPTPSGWTTMEAVRVGDWLIGSNGQPCQVTAKSQVKRIGTRVVTFGDGHQITCDPEHYWWVIEGPSIKGTPTVVGVDEIRARLMRGGQVNFRVPIAEPTELPEKSLPLDPYVLGVWLGDGNSHGASFTCHNDDIDEMATHLSATGTQVGRCYQAVGNADTYALGTLPGIRSIETGRMLSNGSLASVLIAMDVMKNKHVPVAYTRASIAQRQALVQGLMDTDGSWNGNRLRAVYTSTNPKLVEAFADILASLGERASVDWRHVPGFGDGCYRGCVEWSPLRFNPFRLARKASKVRTAARKMARSGYRTIVSVEEGHDYSTACVAVDSPNHTYLCGRAMIPTHNTKDGLAAVRKKLNDDDNRRQIHLQYYAMVQAHGWPTTGVVRNMFVDRSGSDPNPVVVQEPFDLNVVLEAAERLWDALYAARNNERAHQDRYRSFCESCCPWVGTCRGGEVQGEDTPIFDERQRLMIEAYVEAGVTEKAGKTLREELRPHLLDLIGKTSDGRFSIKTTVSNKTPPVKTITARKLPEQKAAAK